MRIDKWLWVARLLKTRALASEAVKGGRVHVNGRAAKPSREVGPDDRIELSLGQTRITLIVRGVAERRGPAREAALLYEETAESREAREQFAAERRLSRPTDLGGRPTKRDRRRYEQSSGRRR
jgi:ribosome-associated heat shock protein Hsp15